MKTFVYFDKFYSTQNIYKVLEDEGITEVVVLNNHTNYTLTKKWANRNKIPCKEVCVRSGLYGEFAPHMAFKEAVEEGIDKVVIFGQKPYSLISQAQLNNIPLKGTIK